MLRPENEASVVEIIHSARATGRRVRVHGARHSVFPSIGTGTPEGLEVHLDRLDRLEMQGTRAIVGGGVRIGGDALQRVPRASSLLHLLERHERALPNLGGVTSQTLAGFLATGSAGGSLVHRPTDLVRRIRFVDGRGEIHDVSRGDPLFSLAGVSMGLLGMVTEIELDTEPAYDVIGEETVYLRADAPFDLRAEGAAFDWLARQEYARVLFWPQPGAQRIVTWTARRIQPSEYARLGGTPATFRPRPYRALPAIAGSELPMQVLASLGFRALDAIPDERFTRLLLGGFLPSGTQEFWDRWDRALPMDDNVDERLVPVEFVELWFSREASTEALRRLDDFFTTHALAEASNFAVELYAGADSPFVMSPGHGQPSLRINVFHMAHNRRTAAARFAPIFELFSDLAPRLHWGKHLPSPPRARPWLERAFPALGELLKAREEHDPDGVFLSDYWRDRLGIEPRRVVTPTPTRTEEMDPDLRTRIFSWPMAFELEPVGLDFIPQAKRKLVYTVDCHAEPAFLFDAFAHMEDGREWMEQFVSMISDRRGPGAVFDETFTFMKFRARTLVFDRPNRWVARLEASSIPLATRMIEEVTFTRRDDGRTHLVWTFSLDPHPLALPFEKVITPVFDGLFSRSLARLGRFAEARAGIQRHTAHARP